MSEQVSRLPIIRKTIKTNVDFFTVIVLGDIHFGHKSCDERACGEMVNWIAEKDPNEFGVILTGDLIENVLPTSKGSLFEMKYPSPEVQIEKVTELLQPIAGHTLLLCDGNHEDRTQRTAGITPSRYIAKDLGVPYVGYHGIMELTLQNKGHREQYTIYAEHGCGSIPKAVAGRYSKLEAIQKQVEADVYVKGHIHHKNVFAKEVWKKVGGQMVKRKVVFASNGSYLIDAEYAIRSGFEPTTPGVARVQLSSKSFNIHSSI